MKDLAKASIIVFHNTLSREGKVGMFVFKTLSCFLGGTVVSKNYSKVILIDKMKALDIFGYLPGYTGCRQSFFYTYTAAALSAGISNVEELEDYGKQQLLHFRGQKPLLLQDKPEIVDVNTETQDVKEE